MKYHLEIYILGLPKTVNALGRSHWAVKVKHNKKWQAEVSWAIISSGNKRPEKPLKKAEILLTRYSSTEPDYDNLVNSFKCVLDALIINQIIENDNREVIDYPTYAWQKCRPKEGRICVEVYEK